jgi:predicted transcriptional regulator
MDSIKRALKQLELSDSEINVYLKIMENNMVITDIASQLSLTRKTVYNHLDKLEKIGLIFKQKNWQIKNPKIISELLNLKISTLHSTKNKIIDDIQNWEIQYKTKTNFTNNSRSIVGLDRLKDEYYVCLNEITSNIYTYGNVSSFFDLIGYEQSFVWRKKRESKNIVTKAIIYERDLSYVNNQPEIKNITLKVFRGQCKSNLLFSVLDDKILLLIDTEKCIMQKHYDQNLIFMYKQIFDQLWQCGNDVILKSPHNK